jgi:DNA-binding protein H-NS
MSILTIPTTDKAIAELEAKIVELEKELDTAKDFLQKAYEHRKLGRVRQVNELITKLGLNVDDMANVSMVQMVIKRAVKAPSKASSKPAKGNSSEYVAPPAKWAKEGFKPYGGGRGKKPQWVKDAEANGTLDNYLIKKP